MIINNKKDSKDIFISFRTTDGLSDAAYFFKVLMDEGYNVFFNCKSIEGGKTWPVELHKAINECKILILICTPDMFNKMNIKNINEDWVLTELMMAKKLDKIILPIFNSKETKLIFESINKLDIPQEIKEITKIQGLIIDKDNIDDFFIKVKKILSNNLIINYKRKLQ